MRMKRILSGLLVVVMVLGMVNTSVFAVSGSKEVLSDVPFDYMTNMKNRSLDSYEDLSTPEKKLVYSIPDGVAETLTTEALLETILNNEYIIDLFAYDDFIEAVKSREVQYRIIELLERVDSIEVLDTYIDEYEDKIAENYSADTNRQLRLMKKIKDNAYYILNDVERPLSRMLDWVVYTKGNQEVYCYKDRNWVNSTTTTQEEEAEDYEEYLEKYDVTVVSGISPIYNCHSYAWYNSNYSSNNIWIEGEEELQKYIAESRQDTDTPQIGYTKVVYYYNISAGLKVGNISHSAKVYSVYSNGTVASVISKWGNNGLFIHAIDECPYTYAIFNPEVDYFNY